MSQPEFSISRKHLLSEQHPLQELSRYPSKTRKVGHPEGPHPPPNFWDKLSNIWLTEGALEELDRRSSPPTRHSSSQGKSKGGNHPVADFLAHCSTRSLEEIDMLSRHGGPDLSDLRGYRKFMEISRKTRTTTNAITIKITGPHDRNFHQDLIDSGVYPDEYEYPDGKVPPRPNNWKEINKRLAQRRSSLSQSQISDSLFRKFKRLNAHAFKEEQTSISVIRVLEGENNDIKCLSGKIPFTNLNHLIDGNIIPGNPYLFYGARPRTAEPASSHKARPLYRSSTQYDLPIIPNFFLAAKGTGGALAVAERQSCYDGALGARGMHYLQLYGQDESMYDNTSSTITAIYYGGQLKIYATHSAQPNGPGGRPEYYMTQINTWGMTGNVENFLQGASAFKNARDWAKEQRDRSIRQANERQSNEPPVGSGVT
ncbi:hypothetical protein BJ875DRAFT_489859 [Amylocarpus encephaloides]|uniref:Uncharacterized protein n=1 Tax=Amylocarpus encephaloides TaxID=45428 RepID=A0A9P8BZJ8_9HELO|nr:hypothetical protein BJ875DRAFT_489859 [Amylocarpus encephaloides]